VGFGLAGGQHFAEVFGGEEVVSIGVGHGGCPQAKGVTKGKVRKLSEALGRGHSIQPSGL
jgi:hypothetical protein